MTITAADVRWEELAEGARFTVIDRQMLGEMYRHAIASLADPSGLLLLAYQYKNDLLYPPAPDSLDRRIAAIDAAIAHAGFP